MKLLISAVLCVLLLGGGAYWYFNFAVARPISGHQVLPAESHTEATSTRQAVSDNLWPKGFPQGLPAEYRGRVIQNFNLVDSGGQIIQSTRVYWSAKSTDEVLSDFKNYFGQNSWSETDYAGNAPDRSALREIRDNKSAEIIAVSQSNRIWFDDFLSKSLPETGEKTLVYISFWEDKNSEPVLQMNFPENKAVVAEISTSSSATGSASGAAEPGIAAPKIPSKTYNLQSLKLNITQASGGQNAPVQLGQAVDISWEMSGLSTGSKYSAWVWCNQNSTETNLDNLPQADKVVGSTYNGGSVGMSKVCSYSSSGSHTIKAIVISGLNMGEARREITVASKDTAQVQNGVTATAPDPGSSCVFSSLKSDGGRKVSLNWSCPSPDYSCIISPPATGFSGSASGTVILAPRWNTVYNVNCSNGLNIYSNSIKVDTGNSGS